MAFHKVLQPKTSAEQKDLVESVSEFVAHDGSGPIHEIMKEVSLLTIQLVEPLKLEEAKSIYSYYEDGPGCEKHNSPLFWHEDNWGEGGSYNIFIVNQTLPGAPTLWGTSTGVLQAALAGRKPIQTRFPLPREITPLRWHNTMQKVDAEVWSYMKRFLSRPSHEQQAEVKALGLRILRKIENCLINSFSSSDESNECQNYWIWTIYRNVPEDERIQIEYDKPKIVIGSQLETVHARPYHAKGRHIRGAGTQW